MIIFRHHFNVSSQQQAAVVAVAEAVAAAVDQITVLDLKIYYSELNY